MEMKAMPTAMDALLNLRDIIVNELEMLKYLVPGEYMEVNEGKKAFLVKLYNLLPDEVAEGIVKPEGEEEWYGN